ncbi:hypothetical protein GCM10007857_80870 [Bradyrhizobium iriomotense]|uniref:Uncharacterized protein n=1 Tax=Bradyrhizobium iriomotense TaxID=441950 RepID=A0ABQ6BAI4_9BRAD|nr:hypothetical protein GCM10007857_80870 [Bradyrhizobium iriomotense]
MTCPWPTTSVTASAARSGSTAATQYDLSPSVEMTATMGKRTIIKEFHTESRNCKFKELQKQDMVVVMVSVGSRRPAVGAARFRGEHSAFAPLARLALAETREALLARAASQLN